MSQRNRLLGFLLGFISLTACAHAQVAIPNTFVNGTSADADQVNANFQALGTSALNRTGGTLTGTLTTRAILPSANNTYAIGTNAAKYSAAHIVDGSDIAALAAANITAGGTLPALNGSALTSLSSSNLTGALPALSGAALTSLTAANISAGTAGINISGNAATATSATTATTAATATNGVVTTGSYADPAWITSLAGSKITGNINLGAGTLTAGTTTLGGLGFSGTPAGFAGGISLMPLCLTAGNSIVVGSTSTQCGATTPGGGDLAVHTLVTTSTINGQTISATANFTGTVNITSDTTFGGFLVIPAGAAISGTRFICINTSGQLISQAAACSGT